MHLVWGAVRLAGIMQTGVIPMPRSKCIPLAFLAAIVGTATCGSKAVASLTFYATTTILMRTLYGNAFKRGRYTYETCLALSRYYCKKSFVRLVMRHYRNKIRKDEIKLCHVEQIR